MISTELYNGQGLGNQLFAYVMTRVIALDNGYDFGIIHPEKFKGSSFLNLDFGKKINGGAIPYEGGIPISLPDGITNYFREERLNHSNGTDIRDYDWKIKNIKDNTKIDGLFQGEDYFSHRKDEIRKWLSVNEIVLDSNICVINFRGGEYVGGNELFLDISYWKNSIEYLKNKVPNIKFKIVTDDVKNAKKFFPQYDVSHDIGNDYKMIQSANYLILSNSSFALFPAWLNQNAKIIIAPKYWARHNVSCGYWALSYNIMNGWLYMNKNGEISDSETCKNEKTEYMSKNKETFWIGEPEIKENTRIQKVAILIKKITPTRIKKFIKKVRRNHD